MILKGNFIWMPAMDRLEVRENAWLVTSGETVVGIYDQLPPEYAGQPVKVMMLRQQTTTLFFTRLV